MATNDLQIKLMEDIEQVMKCNICLNRIQLPKSLSCHHSFCLLCLKNWIGKNKGVLTCPTCSRSEPIPEGGLEKLQPNTFLNNLLETMEKYEKRIEMNCVCGSQAKYYCQECRHNLCSSCSGHHKLLPMAANHKLHTVEDVQSMTLQQFALLNPPMCSVHCKKLESYCIECKIPTCMNCLITEHRVWEGKHTPISISDAFNKVKETTAELEEATLQYKNKLQDCLDAVIQNDKKLDQNKDDSLRDIENHVQQMNNTINENGEKIKNSITKIYKEKKDLNDKQMKELKLNICDVNINLSCLHQLLKSDEATVMQSSENVTKALKEKIKELPLTEPQDNGELCFVRNKHQFDSLKKSDIGNIYQKMPAECFTCILTGPKVLTQGQTIDLKILKTRDIDINVNQLDVTWTQSTRETNVIGVKRDFNGDHIVRVTSTSPGISRLDASIEGKPIKQSPMTIKVEKEGLINTINIINGRAAGVVKCEDGCLLVSCSTNEIYKYKLSGEYINKITLSEDVKVDRMYKMKNGNIVFSDSSTNKECIKVCNMDGQVIKTIGKEILYDPVGIHVDETLNVVYVADRGNGKDISDCFLFDLDSRQRLKRFRYFGYNGGFSDITVTRSGYVLVVDLSNQVLLFNNKAKFLKVLITDDHLDNPFGIAVDQDDNIIMSSSKNLKLFSMDGTFIKQINKDEDGLNFAGKLTIISYYPRQIAVANIENIKIFNY